jgi:MFS superfamily sulfate permease-like transporter
VLSILLFFRRAWWPRGSVLGYVERLGGWYTVERHPDEAAPVPGVVVFRWEAPLFFANAAVFRGAVRDLIAESSPPPTFLVVQCEAITDIDVTAADMLERLETELHDAGITLVFVALRNRLVELLRRYGMDATLDRCRFHRTVELAIADLTT